MFRYYVVNFNDATVYGTNNTEEALYLASCEDFVVIDRELDTQINLNGSMLEIKQTGE